MESAPALVGDIVRTLDLPSGGSVTFRDPGDLRAKDKRHVLNNVTDVEKAMKSGLDILDGIIMLLIEAWHIPYLPNAPLPRDMPAILGELQIPDYDTLTAAAQPVIGLLFPAEKPSDAGKPGTPM